MVYMPFCGVDGASHLPEYPLCLSNALAGPVFGLAPAAAANPAPKLAFVPPGLPGLGELAELAEDFGPLAFLRACQVGVELWLTTLMVVAEVRAEGRPFFPFWVGRVGRDADGSAGSPVAEGVLSAPAPYRAPKAGELTPAALAALDSGAVADFWREQDDVSGAWESLGE